MNKTEAMKIAKMLSKFAQIPSDKGELMIEGELAEGAEIFILGEDGEYAPAPDGEYVTDNGTIKVEGGVVKEIAKADPQDPEPPKTEEQKQEEEHPTDPQPDEKDAKIAELEAANAELNNQITEKDAKIAELEAKVAELEAKVKEPVDDPLKMQKEAQEKAERIKNNPALRFFQD